MNPRSRYASDLLQQFGLRVRQLRKAQGFSQEAFADKCQLDRTYIGGIERGERNVSLINIHTIAQGLEMPICELMKGL